MPDDVANIALRKQLDQRLIALRADRMSYFMSWREVSKYLLPRRGRYLITPNKPKGLPKGQAIIDPHGTIQHRIMASGMMAGITSPARPWFQLTVADPALRDNYEVKSWCGEVQRRVLAIFAKSNFYNGIHTCYQEIGAFGTCAMLQLEDRKDVNRWYPLTAGEYYLGVDNRYEVDTLYREFTMTCGQLMQEFGLENCSAQVRAQIATGSVDQEIMVGHAIEPNDKRIVGAPGIGNAPIRSVYWELGQAMASVLRVEGFIERPFMAARWEVVSNDAYGKGPGDDAVASIKQLQLEQKRKAQGIDKMVNPPLLGDAKLKNEPQTLLPGGITYLEGTANTVGLKPIYEVKPDLEHMIEDIREVKQQIGQIFYTDLFMAISQMDGVQPRNELEITERRGEKLLQLGPMLERFHNEGLTPVVTRTFNSMRRAGLIPTPPDALKGVAVNIDYISMLAVAQKGIATSGLEKVVGFVGNIAAAKPDALDKLDTDEIIDEYADMMGVSPKIIIPTAKVQALRDARAKQQAAAAAVQNSMAAAQGAKTLSETDVGGGQNALQKMMGGAA